MSESTSVFEIVELEDGEIALTRIDGEGEPLVSIKFSEESLSFLRNSKIDVAKAMIEAGLDAVAEIEDDVASVEEAVLH